MPYYTPTIMYYYVTEKIIKTKKKSARASIHDNVRESRIKLHPFEIKQHYVKYVNIKMKIKYQLNQYVRKYLEEL